MPNKHWLDINTNWGDTNGWSLTEGGVGGAGVPADADTVYVKLGVNSITTGLAPGAGFNNFAGSLNILTRDGVSASGVTIGDGSNGLAVNAVTVNIMNRNAAFIKLAGTGTNATVNCRSLGGGKLYVGAGTVTAFYGGSDGSVDFSANVELTAFQTSGMSALIRADATANNLTLDISRGANVECWRRVSDASIGGTLTLANAAEIASSGTARVVVESGGVLRCKQTGAIASVIVKRDGTLFAGDTGSVFTLTQLIRHDGARIILPPIVVPGTTIYAGGSQETT